MPMAPPATAWTLDELHALPDDGNKYELVRGELFVTPAPSPHHEGILARLTRIIDPFVARHELGLTFRARAALQFAGSEVEPDLMVRRVREDIDDWESAPAPMLVVEVQSPTTRRRDLNQKRALYLHAGVAEYWVVDPEARTVLAIRAGKPDVTFTETARWSPTGVAEVLEIRLADVFAGMLP